MARHIEEFKPKPDEINHNVNNAALVILDPHNGEILALVGSWYYSDLSIDLEVAISSAPSMDESK